MKLVTVEEMKRLEQAADAAGHSYAAMMECAGRAVASAVRQRTQIVGKYVLVLVGPGNNGGDGLVAARHLTRAGAQVVCYLWKPCPDDDPNWQRVQGLSIHCVHSSDDDDARQLRDALQNAYVIVDSLLGTGVCRPIGGQLKQILEIAGEVVSLRRSAKPMEWTDLWPSDSGSFSHPPLPSPFVVAVDVPSGLNCDTGAVDPVTLPADLTVTFAAPKRGQFRFPGAETIGELVIADIGIDPTLGVDILTEVITAQDASALLPARPLDAHKGTFGKAMIVAGSVNYTGAPYLAAAAAARVGAGLVTLAPPQPLYPTLAAKLTEATFILLPHNMGILVPSAVQVLTSRLETYQAMLLGPGLGRERETVLFVHQLLGITAGIDHRRIGFRHGQEPPTKDVALPSLVIDADGLNAMAEAENWWTYLPDNSILTPHPGEMSRLTGTDTRNEDRIAVAREKASEWKQVVVLKGAYTVVAAPDGRVAVIPFANPGLATAGTGDVLAGAIVGLLTQGLKPFEAAACGAYLHGLAGQIVVEQIGMSCKQASGLLAGDLLPALPRAMKRLSR